MRTWNNHLSTWWEAIQRLEAPAPSSHQVWLTGINPVAAALGLGSLPGIPEKFCLPPEVPAEKPSFKNFHCNMALPLMAGLQEPGKFQPLALLWCEKLMKYCEVHTHDLPSSAGKKWGDPPKARSGLLHIACLLSEAGTVMRDVRWLNTVLKILDCKTAFDLSSVLSRLSPNDPQLDTGLQSVRVILQTESALRRLASTT